MYDWGSCSKELGFSQKVAKTRTTKIFRLNESVFADQVLAIVEVAFNILNSDFNINESQKRRLQLYALYLKITSKGGGVETKSFSIWLYKIKQTLSNCF